jgi:AraC family transcriptional regulator, regulatory protein of adaptative response / DNA-3-methyladenine glycosylase II
VNFETCYRAVESRDPRFNGYFVTAVVTTGIYCRPSCPAITPRRRNVRFFRTAAAAQVAGFRACKRCVPDAAPGSPEWNLRSDLVGRAMRYIAEGVVDRDGVGGLASRLGYSERHVRRQLVAELGAGPIALARAQRAQSARTLLERTSMTVTDVAFAAGFASVRQFNDTIRDVFASSPTELRTRARARMAASNGTIALRLPYRRPFDLDHMLTFLGRRAVPGVEEVAGGVYRRSLDLSGGPAIVELSDGGDHVRCTAFIADVHDISDAIHRCRWILDVDCDSRTIDDALSSTGSLRAIVARAPGKRVPGAGGGAELAVRAVLGQQISIEAARTLAGRLVARYGTKLESPRGSVTHVFPTAARLSRARLESLGAPRSRRDTIRSIASAVASGSVELDPGADRDDTYRRLLAIPGVGPWTAGYVVMRALRDPDVFLSSDLGIRAALSRAGGAGDRDSLKRLAESVSPWGSYATQYLWAALA